MAAVLYSASRNKSAMVLCFTLPPETKALAPLVLMPALI